MNSIHKLLRLFSRKEKQKLIMLLFMMIAAAVFETISIGVIVPFVGMVVNPNVIQEQPVLANVYGWFNFQTVNAFIIFAVGILLAVFVIKNVYLLFFNYIQIKVTLNQKVRLSRDLFQAYLTKPYTFHLQRNTADLLRNVNEEVAKVFNGIMISGFQLLTEMLVILFIAVLLVVTAPLATLAAAVLLGGSVCLFFISYRKKISQLGEEHQEVTGKMIQWVNQGLGASKEVKVSGKERFFIREYTNQSQIQANNTRYLKMLEVVPRYFIETVLVAIVLITALIIILQGSNLSHFISTMALFAMAAFRLMPSINRVVSLITIMRYSMPALHVVYDDLFMDKDVLTSSKSSTEIIRGEKIFHNSIQMDEVSFKYPNQNKYAVQDVSLSIPIGKSVAFVGESGAGKTTIVDIILGLFPPEKGSILVDGVNLFEQRSLWQKKIGYIPQAIFLSDDSIRRNVAFGLNDDQIKDEEVWRALEQAQLKQFVEELPNKLDTPVGERGVMLSGGQRQRVGIARSLYHNPEILFMDEATSALDNKTEKEIMSAFNKLKGNKTLIIIAHRLSTIENCDIVYRINNGRLVSVNNKLNQSIM